MAERLVIGTGRCGSTLLARMMAEHRDVASIHEVLSGLGNIEPSLLENPVLTGAELAEVLSREFAVVSLVLSRGYRFEEVGYPFSEACRYRSAAGIPWILAVTLPHLAEDPDGLFDDLIHEARSLPARSFSDHLIAIFASMARSAGKRAWIERSGLSFERLDRLIGLFPKAKFLHIHRDPRETAVSMRTHTMFKLLPLRFMDWTPADAGDDPIDALLRNPAPPHYYGREVSLQLATGYRAVARLAPEQFAEVRYEDLVAEPARVLEEIAQFFELDPWGAEDLQRAGKLVRRGSRSRFAELASDERHALAEACELAEHLLGRRSRRRSE